MTARDPAPEDDANGGEGLRERDIERDAGRLAPAAVVVDPEKAAAADPPSVSATSSSNGELTAASVNDMPSQAAGPAGPGQEGEREGQGENDDDDPEAKRTPFETNLIVGALCSALFLAALDVTIVTTAVPTIAEEFGSPSGYAWVGSAYLLGNAVSVPSWGKVSDIWGRKPILLLAVATFFVGSLLSAVSVSMGMLIAGRAVQGVGGGGIVVLVNICITDLFSMRRRGVYYGVMGIVWAVASALGPVLGGVFTSEVTWRWCFYVNLPISGLGFGILVSVLRLHNPRTPVRRGLAAVDWAGTALVVGGTLMLLFGLELGGIAYPWGAPTTVCLLAFGALTLALFYGYERRLAAYPIMPARLFRPRQNVVAFFVAFCHGMVFISGSYWLPLYFQAVLGAGPLLSGLYLLPYALSLSFVAAGTGLFVKKTGLYLPGIVFGMAAMTLGFGLLVDLGARANWAKLVLYQVVAGVGVGPNFQSPLLALQSRAQPGDVAAVTSTFAFVRQLATSVSVVVGGVVFQNAMERQHPALLAAGLEPGVAARLSGGNAAGSAGLVASLPGAQGDLARAAYWAALRNIYIFAAAWAAVGLLASPFVGSNVLSKEHREFKTGLDSLRRETEREK